MQDTKFSIMHAHTHARMHARMHAVVFVAAVVVVVAALLAAVVVVVAAAVVVLCLYVFPDPSNGTKNIHIGVTPECFLSCSSRSADRY